MSNGHNSLFKRGLPTQLKFFLYAIVAVALLVADGHFDVLGGVKHTLSTALYPLQRFALAPRDMVDAFGEYFSSVDDLVQEAKDLRQQALEDAPTLQRVGLLERENEHLRNLLGMKGALKIPTQATEILYDAKNEYEHKVVINLGSAKGVKPGQPVIDGFGVIGQVSDVASLSSEVTLLTDKEQAIPVLNVRSGSRSIAYGMGNSGWLELRYMSNNADFQTGDDLVTSGIDGIYPPGVAVGKVVKLADDPENPGDHYACVPAAGINRHRQVLVLMTDPQSINPRPDFQEMARQRKKEAQRAARQAALKAEQEKQQQGATENKEQEK